MYKWRNLQSALLPRYSSLVFHPVLGTRQCLSDGIYPIFMQRVQFSTAESLLSSSPSFRRWEDWQVEQGIAATQSIWTLRHRAFQAVKHRMSHLERTEVYSVTVGMSCPTPYAPIVQLRHTTWT
ncbi:unnamed protein product, partial [Protopolystoma xenopodis]